MADNVPITPGSGATIATDEVGGVQIQRVKLVVGADGIDGGNVSDTVPLPTKVLDAGNATLGAKADASAGADTGTFTLMSFIKWIASKIKAVGQATMANSHPVVVASDQSAIPVTQVHGALTDRSGTITSGGTRQALAASNAARRYLMIQNQSSETLSFNFTTNAVAGQPSIQLLPNQTFIMEGSFVSTEAVDILGATTASAFAAKEG